MSLFSLFKKKKEEPTQNQSSYFSNWMSQNNISSPKIQTTSPLQTTQDIKNKLGISTGSGSKVQGSGYTDQYASTPSTYKTPTVSASKTQQTQQSSVPSYISGYESLAQQKKNLLGEQKTSGEDYLNRYYGAKESANQANINALQKNLAANKASYAKALEGQKALTETKKQNVEDVWGTTQRQSAQTRAESEARNRNKFAALGTMGSWGAGSYGQAQENVESDFNRLTQENLRQKAADLQDLDLALQEYELESQAKLDTLDLEVTQAINSIIADNTMNEIEKENAIKELGFSYQEAVMSINDELQGYYKDYYNALASAEEGLSFDESGQPLNQKSYEWMLTNPEEYQTMLDRQGGGQSAEKQNLIGLVDQALNTNLGSMSGLWGRSGIGSLSGQGLETKALIEQIQNSLALDAREKLKGQGQISDNETQMLANSVAKLRAGMTESGLKTELREIKNILEGKYRYDESGYTKPSLETFEVKG